MIKYWINPRNLGCQKLNSSLTFSCQIFDYIWSFRCSLKSKLVHLYFGTNSCTFMYILTKVKRQYIDLDIFCSVWRKDAVPLRDTNGMTSDPGYSILSLSKHVTEIKIKTNYVSTLFVCMYVCVCVCVCMSVWVLYIFKWVWCKWEIERD